MKVLVICDSFKGSLSSKMANLAILTSLKKLNINAKSMCISDGGEGFLESINEKIKAEKIYLNLKNAYGKRDYNGYYLLKNNQAFFEMAEFAGIAQLDKNERNPLKTSTFSLGIAIKNAILKNVKEFVIGIGGSATNDAGTGMLNALGYEFLDEFNNPLNPIGENLIKIKSINDKNVLKELKNITFKIANDVNNPLFGEYGAAYIYARQKGASDEDIKLLDDGLRNFASICKDYFKNDYSLISGTGAAGGLGFGFKAFLNAEFLSGFSYIKNLINLEEEIKKADLIITGEGAFDEQSLMGKVIGEIHKICKNNNKKMMVFCGINNSNFDNSYSLIDYFKDKSQDELMNKDIAYKCLEELSFNIIKRKMNEKN